VQQELAAAEQDRDNAQAAQQRNAKHIRALTARCSEAHHQLLACEEELIRIRETLRRAREQHAQLVTQHAALSAAQPRWQELRQRDRTLTRDAGVALLAMAVGAVVFLATARYRFAVYDVASPQASS
jgi:chromosome segregation ATPase